FLAKMRGYVPASAARQRFRHGFGRLRRKQTTDEECAVDGSLLRPLCGAKFAGDGSAHDSAPLGSRPSVDSFIVRSSVLAASSPQTAIPVVSNARGSRTAKETDGTHATSGVYSLSGCPGGSAPSAVAAPDAAVGAVERAPGGTSSDVRGRQVEVREPV